MIRDEYFPDLSFLGKNPVTNVTRMTNVKVFCNGQGYVMNNSERDKKGRFLKGNRVAKKEGRYCANYPFCKERIDTSRYPNKKYHSRTCRRYALTYRKRNNLVSKK